MLALQAAAAYGIGALLTKTQAIACTSLLGVHFSAEIALSALLTLLTVGTAAFAFHSIGTALQCVVELHNHFQEHTKRWLQANGLPPPLGDCFPLLTGGATEPEKSEPFWPVRFLPLLLGVAWVIAGIAGIYFIFAVGGHPRCR